jgi:ribosomal protein S18 acetylase RimI-like enzyme
MQSSCPTCGLPGMPVAWGRMTSDYHEVFRLGLAVEGGCVSPKHEPTWACARHHMWPDPDVEGYWARLAAAFRGRPHCPLCHSPSAHIVRSGHEDHWAEELRSGEAVAVDDPRSSSERICRTCGHRWNPLDELFPDSVFFYERRDSTAEQMPVQVEEVTGGYRQLVEEEVEADPEPFVDTGGFIGEAQAMFLNALRSEDFVARHDGVLVGYLIGQLGPRGVAYLMVIAVRRPHRGRGVGAALWRAFTRSAAARGAHEYRAYIRPDQVECLEFHRTLGVTGELVNDLAGPLGDRFAVSTPLQA